MKVKITIVKTPQLGTNENNATLVDWLVSDEGKVNVNDIICSLENTKATFDVEAKNKGYVVHLVEVGAEVAVNDVLAIIVPSIKLIKEEKNKILSSLNSDSSPTNLDDKLYKATEKAAKIAKELQIDLSLIEVKGIIKEKDVVEYAKNTGHSIIEKNNIEERKTAKTVKLIGNRKKTKDLMLYSNKNIPHSYIEKVVIVDRWIEKIRSYIETEGNYITFLSVIICGLAKGLIKHKIFNSYRDGDSIHLYNDVNVGVVISLEKNISVAIIKKVDKLNPVKVTKELMRIRKGLHKKKSNPDDFIGGTMTVSAMDHTEITSFNPIIHPEQAAVLAIPKIQNKIVLDTNGLVCQEQYINLGISFDHSYLDANQGNTFLTSLSEEIDLIIENL
jgi:pyruvate/2-oxoglutarate dehydrogenase complex dihydrolipoamide acyltransferase (E2) component